MATSLAERDELKCPLCKKILTAEEYQHVKEELERTIRKEYETKRSAERIEDQEKVSALQTQIEQLQKRVHVANAEGEAKGYGYARAENDQLRRDISEREKQLEQLQERVNDARAEGEAKGYAYAKTKNDELQREINQGHEQLKRVRTELEELRKKTSTTQSELTGKVGETDLLAMLRNERDFREDIFTQQKRGTPGADIIQQIRMPSGELLTTTIGYDNKEKDDVGGADIEKAVRDKREQGIGYMIIASHNLPKKIKNGYIGASDGILLVNTSILVEYVRTIRTMIMRTSKISESMRGQKTKQEELYGYITSERFCRSFERILDVHTKHCELQTREERNHKSLWSSRKQLKGEMIDAYYDISSEVERITQKPTTTEEANGNNEEGNGNSEEHP